MSINMSFRLKSGKLPAWMSTKPGYAGAAMPPMPANLVPTGSAGDDGLGYLPYIDISHRPPKAADIVDMIVKHIFLA
jgi:inosine-uridine nucleoside N-ribohydrolase